MPDGVTVVEIRQGPQGPQGATGATGPAGPTGPQGPAGSPASVTATNIDAALAADTSKASNIRTSLSVPSSSDPRLSDERTPTSGGMAAKTWFATTDSSLDDTDAFPLTDASITLKKSTLATLFAYINSKFATEDTTPADADRLAVVSPAGGWLSLSRLWDYVKSKLDAAGLTIAGSKSFSGQVELTGQAATTATSAMTRGLVDTRCAIDFVRGTYRWSNTAGAYSSAHMLSGSASTNADVLDLTTSSTAGSVSFLRSNLFNIRVWHLSLGTGRGICNWSRRTVHSVRIFINDITGANTVARILLGQANTNTTAQDLQNSDRGIGFRIVNGLVNVQVANGSAVTTTSTGVTLASLTENDLALDCDGAGGWACYINGALAVSGTGAPTGNSTAANNALCMSLTNGTTAAIRQLYIVQQVTVQI